MKTIKNYVFFLSLVFLAFTVNAQDNKGSFKDLLFLAEFDNYEEWYTKGFKSDAIRRSEFCKESYTVNGKINEETALVVLRDFNMKKMPEFTSDKTMMDIMKKHNIRHNEVYEIESLNQNNFPKGKASLFFIVDCVDYDMWFWDAFVPDAERRSKFCDEARTRVAKVNDKKSMVILYDFDIDNMKEFESNERVGELMRKYQVNHDVYLMKSI